VQLRKVSERFGRMTGCVGDRRNGGGSLIPIEVADLTLDRHILQEIVRKNVWSAPVLQATRMTDRAPATMYPAC
jgi:hypothetical protein